MDRLCRSALPCSRIQAHHKDYTKYLAPFLVIISSQKMRAAIQRKAIGRLDSHILGGLRQGTDPDLPIDVPYGPLFFRWLQAHASIFESVIPAFETK